MKEIKSINGIKKLYALFVILPQSKKEVFIDLTEVYNVNYHISFQAQGSANKEIRNLLGLKDLARNVTISFVREDKVKACLDAIEDKINQMGLNAVAFAVQLDSLIGNQNYRLLADLGGTKWIKN